MAVVIVTSLGLTEIAECGSCRIQFVIPAEDVDMFNHEMCHHDGDEFCCVYRVGTPYILGST